MKHKDAGLSPEQLDDIYNPNGYGEHQEFTRRDWRQAVENQDTISGYWVWVAAQIRNADESL